MAELTAVGWVLSPIMKKLADMAFSYSVSQYNRQKDMQKNFENFADILTEIKKLVAKAEDLQSMDTSEQMPPRWKAVICDAENLLDAFRYRILEAQTMEAGGTVSHAISSSHELAKRLIGPDKLAYGLKEILPRLVSVGQSAHDQVVRLHGHNATQQPKMHDRVTTSSILPIREIFGRAKEKEEVINLLLKGVDEPESSHTNVPVIAIVGDGGIGKTTLAQLVYDDKRINDNFFGIWIHVSKNFDESRLTREILGCISNRRNKDVTNFNALQQELRTKVRLKQFLLVLDDVWIDGDNKACLNVAFFNQKICKTLLAPLKDSTKGSKILITTRMEIVADVFDATKFPLKGLPDNETWSLLKRHAFGNEIPYNSSELEEIGQQNIKRLDGSPLAAGIVGSLLKNKRDAESWSEILGRRIHYGIMPTLLLSYQYLPNHLKYCFAFCSIFPKSWKFEPKNLVLLWIAQGYVLQDETERSLRDIGMDYFDQLLSSSLFEKVEQHYVMHDLINDLAQYVSKDECFRIDGGKREISKTVKHLGIVVNYGNELGDIFAQLGEMSNLKNLRTLMLFGSARFSHADLPLGILKELKSLRVLDFGTSLASQFPEALCHSLHLRYLNLGPHYFGMLPKSLSKLYLLQVLSAGQLPLSQNMFRLLKFGEPKFLAVQRLEFKVERERCHRIRFLKNMDIKIVAIEGDLCIMNLENVTDKAEAAEADLGSKQYLDGLELHWDSSSARINGHEADQGVAEALKPHPNLKRLTIKGSRGRRCPRWLGCRWLYKLQSLSVIDCSELEVLPSLDYLRSLKKCTVKGCPKLKSFPRFLPMLEQIEISETGLISKLSLFSSSSPKYAGLSTTGISSQIALLHDHHLQAIQQLSIRDCKEAMLAKWLLRFAALKELYMDTCEKWLISEEEEDGGGILPSSLESLHISNCPVTERWLSKCLQSLTSLKYLEIRNCPELKSLPQQVGCGVLAMSLKSLYIFKCPVTDVSLIYHCRSLKTLSLGDCAVTDLSLISHCPSLKYLAIKNCPGLKSLWEEDGGRVLATSLESPYISECPVTDLSLISHCPSLKHLRVENCPGLKSLLQEDGGSVLATSLESLHISECPVTDVSWISHCTSLKTLNIRDCPALKSLPEKVGGGVLLSSLKVLDICKCPVTDLSLISHCPSLKYLTVANCPGLQSLPQRTSLKELTIANCPELKSLSKQDGSDVLATVLESLHISKCPVTDISLICHCPSLKYLAILDCTELKSLPMESLPTSLEEVDFYGCGVPKESIVRCLQGLPSLSRLTVDFWTHFTALTSLYHLTIKSCRFELNSKGELPQALPHLKIYECDVSDAFLSTCLQGLTSLSDLIIENCNKLTSLPSEQVLHRLTALQSLTLKSLNELTSLGALHALSSLKSLDVDNCPKVKSLPKKRLPSSIVYLTLENCLPALEQQIREKKGPDWDKVVHIPYIHIE